EYPIAKGDRPTHSGGKRRGARHALSATRRGPVTFGWHRGYVLRIELAISARRWLCDLPVGPELAQVLGRQTLSCNLPDGVQCRGATTFPAKSSRASYVDAARHPRTGSDAHFLPANEPVPRLCGRLEQHLFLPSAVGVVGDVGCAFVVAGGVCVAAEV